jgi:DNA modification methylase
MIFPKPKVVSFREKVNGIKKSTYLTHSLYYYPAKFIPQIVRFCLDEYTPKGGVVLDPFAGSGTMGVEASTQGYESYMLDINPLLDFFYPLKIPSFTKEEWEQSYSEAKDFLKEVLHREPKVVVKINDNISYWYPEKLYSYFCKIWTNFHELKDKKSIISKNAVALVLFRISKYYSYAEHSMPKLFISKRKRALIEKKLKDPDLFGLIERIGFEILKDIKQSVDTLIELGGKLKPTKYFAGVDSSAFDFSKIPEVDCIITSPPYLQAQEYIRTFKLEMMWLGIPQDKIKEYMSKEIPFREAPSKIEGDYINKIREKIGRKDLLKLFDSYFWFTIKALENASKRLVKGGKLCVLIGNPKMKGIEVEIWKVIYEYFVDNLHFKFIDLFDDKIVYRKLFTGRNNQNPEGMKSEYLLVLEKK